MVRFLAEKRPVTNSVFMCVVVGLSVFAMTVGLVGYYWGTNAVSNQLQTNIDQLQANYAQLQANYDQLHDDYGSLQSNHAILQSNYDSLQSQVASLQSQIQSLYSQLLNATALIAQLQGPTGILPTYLDLGYFDSPYPGAYYLQLSLKNTGATPITQIFVTLNSAQIGMTLTYLNATVSPETPLPPYQTATGRENVSPTIYQVGSYPIIVQALANNGTIYTYQTTITSHV